MTGHGPRAHSCRADDGTVLQGLLWQSPNPAGVVMIRTPYEAAAHASTARSWVERGYHCLVQDVRGRYESSGIWQPYQHEAADGLALLGVLAEDHPDLPVITFGASYAAHTALEAARAAATSRTAAVPAAVITLVPALGLAETAWDAHGRPQTTHRIGWWHQHGRTRRTQDPLSDDALRARSRDVAALGLTGAARAWGWDEADCEAWARLWTAARTDLTTRYAGLHMPLLVISGTKDFFDHDANRLAACWSGKSHIVTGPWGHRLITGITDPVLRQQVRDAGGLGTIIDSWVACHGPSGSPAPWAAQLRRVRRSRSNFDPADGQWHHERTLTMSSANSDTLPGGANSTKTKQDNALPELPIEALVDSECGVIRSVREVPHPTGAPQAYLGLTAAVADARQLGEWPADRVSLGTSFSDPAQARIAAIAEGIERYCGNWLPADLPACELRIGSYEELTSAGLSLIGLDDLPSFASWQYERAGFPYAPLTADTPTLWTRCTDLLGADVWMPASLVYLNWRQSRFRDLPRIHHLNYAGIATGQGVDDARDRGVLEIIERDALELWWHLDGPTIGIDPATVPGLLDDLAGSDLEVSLAVMPSEFASAIAALVFDPARGIYAAGFSAALDPARAARKAVLEAVHTWVYTQGCTDKQGWVFRAVEQGLMAKGLYLDFRDDASYLDAAGPECEHIIDLGAHVQLWLDPRIHHEARRFTAPAQGIRPIDDIPTTSMPEIHQKLADAGHQVLTRDLTTDDVRRTSLRVVRTFVTGLVPNAPAAFSYLGMGRFPDAALKRKWRNSWAGTPADVSLIPPPHM